MESEPKGISGEQISGEGKVRRVFDPSRTKKIEAAPGVTIEVVKTKRRGKSFRVVVTTPAGAPAKSINDSLTSTPTVE